MENKNLDNVRLHNKLLKQENINKKQDKTSKELLLDYKKKLKNSNEKVGKLTFEKEILNKKYEDLEKKYNCIPKVIRNFFETINKKNK